MPTFELGHNSQTRAHDKLGDRNSQFRSDLRHARTRHGGKSDHIVTSRVKNLSQSKSLPSNIKESVPMFWSDLRHAEKDVSRGGNNDLSH